MRRPEMMDLLYVGLLGGGFLVGAFFGGAVQRFFVWLGRSILGFRKYRAVVLTLSAIVLLGGTFFAGAYYKDHLASLLEKSRKGSGTTPSSPPPLASSLGKLMPSGGIVSVVGPPGDRIKSFSVVAGEYVEAGEALVQLSSLEDRREEVGSITIQVEEAKNQQAAINAARAAKLAELDEQVKALKATNEAEKTAQNLKIAYLDKQYETALNRQKRIAGIDQTKLDVGDQEREQVALAVAQAKSELDAAKDGRQAAETRNALQIQAANAQRASAEAESNLALLRVPLASLEKQLALAKLRQERSMLTAPVDGTVLQIVGNEGDPTGNGPILQLAAGTGMVVIAEVYATDVRRLRDAGGLDRITVEVKSQALGDKKVLFGHIVGENAISRSVARNSVVGFSPRSDSDRRVIEVRVELDEESAKFATKYVGLEVEVEFSTRKSSAGVTP